MGHFNLEKLQFIIYSCKNSNLACHLFHSINIFLLRTYNVPNTKDTALNKTNKSPWPLRAFRNSIQKLNKHITMLEYKQCY